ncbi:MAG: dTDP-4-dehydrorhamnose 3,5-epimerase [Rhodobiaceae bacterium]|nr:dTDP-4-dehydrorhamnose 3,5-epimerase [Rhodobiaceae bacterium]MCC0048117.1 dTDP-4-dehydrorhamnose 3,5-epimerase [Rhodobiaceae bacterium]
MHVSSLEIPEIKLVEPRKHGDERGFFSEVFNARLFAGHGIDATFVQDNHSLSRDAGVIRGLHFQAPPHTQGKLVRVVRGAVWDVAVDIRHGSPTFGKHVAAELSNENWRQLWIPAGFAHGFCTLQPNTEVVYKVTDYYAPEADFGVAWDDPALKIDWPVAADEAVLSDRDRKHPRLEDLPAYFP